MKKILLFGEPMALLTTTSYDSLDEAEMFKKTLYGVPTTIPLSKVVFESLQYGRAQLAHGHRLPFGEC